MFSGANTCSSPTRPTCCLMCNARPPLPRFWSRAVASAFKSAAYFSKRGPSSFAMTSCMQRRYTTSGLDGTSCISDDDDMASKPDDKNAEKPAADSFELILKRLEDVVVRLERGELPLEES